jgi:hypothetical protein
VIWGDHADGVGDWDGEAVASDGDELASDTEAVARVGEADGVTDASG